MSEINVKDLRSAFIYLNKQKNKTIKEISEFFGANRDTVSRAIKRFEETGTCEDRERSGRPKTATSNAQQEAISNAIAQNPSTKVNSARKLERRFRISRSSIRRILKRDLRLFPYKMKDRQKLTMDHVRKRLARCRAMRLR